jgi:outer membrane protein
MRLIGLVTGLFLSTFGGNVHAQVTGMVDVFGQASTADPTVLAARRDYEAIQQSVPEARGLYLPNVALTADFTDTTQTINSSDNEVFGVGDASFPTDVLTLSITQPLFRYANIVQLKQAKASVLEAGVRLVAAEQDLILRSATRYLELLAAQDDLEFALAEQQAYEEQLAQVEKRKQVGYADATQVYESRARFEFAKSTVAEAEGVLDDRMEALSELTGERPDQVQKLSETFPLTMPEPSDVNEWVVQANAENLLLQARQHALEVSGFEIKRQKAQYMPTLDLFVSSEQRTTEGSLFGGGSDVDTTDIMVRLTAPIYQGGQVRARKKTAEARYEQARELIELDRRAVQRQTRTAYLGVVNGVSKVNALKQSLESQSLTLESKNKGFKAGTSTNLEVLDAQRDLFLVRRDYAQAKYDYLISHLTLKSLVATLSIEDLEEVERFLVST